QARTPGFGSPSPDAPELFYAEKIFEVILGELLGPTGVFREHARDEVLLLLLQLQDLLLNGPGGHQAVHADHLLLADTMGAVRRLVLHGGVPPWVKVDHGVGGRQVEARAAGL